jgi:hypothetical protein
MRSPAYEIVAPHVIRSLRSGSRVVMFGRWRGSRDIVQLRCRVDMFTQEMTPLWTPCREWVGTNRNHAFDNRNAKALKPMKLLEKSAAPGEIRTPGLLVRSFGVRKSKCLIVRCLRAKSILKPILSWATWATTRITAVATQQVYPVTTDLSPLAQYSAFALAPAGRHKTPKVTDGGTQRVHERFARQWLSSLDARLLIV